MFGCVLCYITNKLLPVTLSGRWCSVLFLTVLRWTHTHTKQASLLIYCCAWMAASPQSRQNKHKTHQRIIMPGQTISFNTSVAVHSAMDNVYKSSFQPWHHIQFLGRRDNWKEWATSCLSLLVFIGVIERWEWTDPNSLTEFVYIYTDCLFFSPICNFIYDLIHKLH